MAGNRQQATDVAKLQQAQRHMEKLQAAVESDRLVAAAEARRYTAQLTQTRQGAQEAREEVMAPGLKKATIVEALSEVEQHKATTAEQQTAMAAMRPPWHTTPSSCSMHRPRWPQDFLLSAA
jgi:hypothetical protein